MFRPEGNIAFFFVPPTTTHLKCYFIIGDFRKKQTKKAEPSLASRSLTLPPIFSSYSEFNLLSITTLKGPESAFITCITLLSVQAEKFMEYQRDNQRLQSKKSPRQRQQVGQPENLVCSHHYRHKYGHSPN